MNLEILAASPLLSAYLSEEETTHFASLLRYLDAAGVSYTLDPYLVRGFDYYTRTAFEIQSPDLGAQNALGGGGRYNKLVEELGGPPTPGIGFGIGLERTLIALQALEVEMAATAGPKAFIITQGEAARTVGVGLLARLRGAGISAQMEYGARSMGKQMKAADRARARYALVIGDDEVAQGVIQFKNLADHWQHMVPLTEAEDWLSGNKTT